MDKSVSCFAARPNMLMGAAPERPSPKGASARYQDLDSGKAGVTISIGWGGTWLEPPHFRSRPLWVCSARLFCMVLLEELLEAGGVFHHVIVRT